MKKKPLKNRRRRNTSNYIYAVLAVMAGVVIASAIIQTQVPREQLPAEEYFEIRDATPIDVNWEKSTNTSLFVRQIRFNLTAVGGNAHSIVVFAPGMTPPEDWPSYSLLKQGDTIDVTLPPGRPFPNDVHIRASEGGFPFELRIDCVEATGTITVMLEP